MEVHSNLTFKLTFYFREGKKKFFFLTPSLKRCGIPEENWLREVLFLVFEVITPTGEGVLSFF